MVVPVMPVIGDHHSLWIFYFLQTISIVDVKSGKIVATTPHCQQENSPGGKNGFIISMSYTFILEQYFEKHRILV